MPPFNYFLSYKFTDKRSGEMLRDGPGTLYGLFVGDKLAGLVTGNIVLYDGLDATGKKMIQFSGTLLAGPAFYPFVGLRFEKGLYVQQPALGAVPLTAIYY